MKQQKHLYDPPVIETIPLRIESFICASGEEQLGNTVGFADMGINDFSGLFEGLL